MIKSCVVALATVLTITPAASRPARLNALAFFKVSHSSHPRDPAWPTRLTLVPHSVSLSEFKTLLRQARWRVTYTCAGRPVPSRWLLYDGVNGTPVVDHVYDETYFTVSYLERSKAGEPYTARTEVHPYTVEDDGHGAFQLNYADGFDPDDTARSVAKVAETQEIVIVSHGLPDALACSDGAPIQGVLVPTQPETF